MEGAEIGLKGGHIRLGGISGHNVGQRVILERGWLGFGEHSRLSGHHVRLMAWLGRRLEQSLGRRWTDRCAVLTTRILVVITILRRHTVGTLDAARGVVVAEEGLEDRALLPLVDESLLLAGILDGCDDGFAVDTP